MIESNLCWCQSLSNSVHLRLQAVTLDGKSASDAYVSVSSAGFIIIRQLQLLAVFICDCLFALVYVKFENVTFGWIRLKKRSVSFETCSVDCYYEGEKCQGFTFTPNDNCVLIRQLFTNSTEGQAVLVGRGRIYVKDSQGLFSKAEVCIPNEMFPRLG
ncbi:unnamed protein product [Toxocara canis]|uniref:Apple domain-containing protein n=1 Tax=Toxocara canis TaxID=6265 RepID=A0A183VB52_TOXCA|nr:unnamed protein product [Toxocara canis]